MDLGLVREGGPWAKLKICFNPTVSIYVSLHWLLFLLVLFVHDEQKRPITVKDQAFCKGISAWETEGASQCDVASQRLFDVMLVSSGGVGSSAMFAAMAQEVSRKMNSGVDRDGLKHGLFHVTSAKLQRLVQNNHTVSCGARIYVYTFADAAASVFSLYRRKFHGDHNKKLHDKPFPPRCFPQNISQYVHDGIDYFGLESHFHSWMHGGVCSRKVPVFFLRSEGRSIPQVWEVLRTALIDPHQAFRGAQRPLNTSTSHYGQEENTARDYAKLQVIYERFQAQLDAMGYLSMAFNNEFKRLL